MSAIPSIKDHRGNGLNGLHISNGHGSSLDMRPGTSTNTMCVRLQRAGVASIAADAALCEQEDNTAEAPSGLE